MKPNLPVGQLPQGTPYIAAEALQARTPRYDTLLFTGQPGGFALPNPLRFFVVPLGQAGDGYTQKTYSQTNMKQSGQLEYPIKGTVDRFMFSLIARGANGNRDSMAQKLAALLEDAVMVFKVDDALVVQEHLLALPGTGVTGVPNMNGVAPEIYVEGSPVQRATTALKPPVAIPSRIGFTVEVFLNSQNALIETGLEDGQVLCARAYMQGIFTRVVS